MVLALKDKVNLDFFWVICGDDDSRFDAGLSGGAVQKPGHGRKARQGCVKIDELEQVGLESAVGVRKLGCGAADGLFL